MTKICAITCYFYVAKSLPDGPLQYQLPEAFAEPLTPTSHRAPSFLHLRSTPSRPCMRPLSLCSASPSNHLIIASLPMTVLQADIIHPLCSTDICPDSAFLSSTDSYCLHFAWSGWSLRMFSFYDYAFLTRISSSTLLTAALHRLRSVFHTHRAKENAFGSRIWDGQG